MDIPTPMKLSIDEFAEQQCRLGRRIHKSDGVWWTSPIPGFSRPLIRECPLTNSEAKPALHKRFFGYAYATVADSDADRYYRPMVREAPGNSFNIDDLTASRRSKVRRGFKKNEIACITDITPFLEDALEIVRSARQRTGAGRSVQYYAKRGSHWKDGLQHLASLPGRRVFAALIGGCMISYFFTTVVDRTLYIDAAKSHSDYLNLYANDALIYTIMEFAYNTLNVRSIVYGEHAPGDDALNYFKESYGFTADPIPERLVLRPGVRLAYRNRRRISGIRYRFL